jgi:hypothetical protein
MNIHSTYRGKIGRLPHGIQVEVNCRLRDGARGRAVAEWLNGLPEVQAVLAREFEGKPVREQNVSEWRKGGYQHWLQLQEVQAMVQQVGPEVLKFRGAVSEPVTETLATWATVQYMVAMKKMTDAKAGQGVAWKQMREFVSDVVALRRGELRSKRIEINHEWARISANRRLKRGHSCRGGTGESSKFQHPTSREIPNTNIQAP